MLPKREAFFYPDNNLWDMKKFYLRYCNDIKLQQAVAVLPWGKP